MTKNIKKIIMAFERGDNMIGDYIKINAIRPTFQFEGIVIIPGPNYEISIARHDDSDKSTRARVEVKKNKFFGYDINRFLDEKIGGVSYKRIGFSFNKYRAGKKAHGFALDIAKEVSEAYGMKLINTSQEDALNFQIKDMESNLGRQIID